MPDSRIKILRDMEIGKAVNKLSLPAIIGFVVMSIYNITDTIFISKWSYQGVAAVQVLFPVMLLAGAIGLAFGIGGGSYISRLLGEDNKKRAKEVLATAFGSGIFVALVYTSIILFNLKAVVKIFGATGDIIPLSLEYGASIVIGSIFLIPTMIFNNALRAEGSAKYSMIGMVSGSILNIILDPIFIFEFDLGLKGAAIATLISKGVNLAILLQYYFRKKSVIGLNLRYFKFELSIYLEIFKIGIPTLFRQVLFSIAMGVLNQACVRVGGEYLLSAMAITGKVGGIPMFVIFGLGQGMQPIVGYSFGAKNQKRLLSAQYYTMKVTFIWSLICFVLLTIFAKSIEGFIKSIERII